MEPPGASAAPAARPEPARTEAERRADERYRLAIRATHEAIWDLDLVTEEVVTNKAYDAMVGVTPGGVSGMQWWTDHVHPEDRDRVLGSFRKAIDESGDEWRCEYRLRRPDGLWATIVDRAYVARDLSGKAYRVVGSMQDLTERQRAERALRESEERFRMALHNAPVSVAVQGLDLRYIWAFNQRTADPHEIVGHMDSEIFTPEEAEHVTAIKRRVLAEGVEHREQMWLKRPSGPMFLDVCFEPMRDTAGRIVGVGTATVDLTPMKLAEEAARLSDQKFVRAFANNPAAIALTLLEDGHVFEVNETWEALTGHGREDVLGRSVRALGLWPSQDEADRFIGELKDKGVVRGWEQVFCKKSGDTFVAQISAQILSSGGEQLILTTLVDVTERKRSEEARREGEARFRLLAWTAGRLLSAPDPQAFVEELCREVMRHLGCDVFFNFLADEEAARLRMNACAGIPRDAAQQMEWLDYGVAVCGCVARDRRRIVAEDISCSDDPHTALVKSFGVQAYCCHPILAQGRLLGTLSFGTRTRPRFTESEVELMRTVTDQVAAAMQRVQSEKALREFSATLEQRVAERTSEVQSLVVRLRELALELTEAELRERRRIARILHDHFQQVLVAAKLQVGVLLTRVRAEQLKASARLADELLTESIQAARTLAVELSPPMLHEAGLVSGLDWLRQRVEQQHNLKVRVTAEAGIDPGTDDIRAFIYESVRELLFNVVKHAGVREARLSVHRRDGDIEVTVEDDGTGLPPASIPARGGFPGGSGLFSIGQRLELLGGSLSFEKIDGPGTRVKLRIPVSALGSSASKASPAPSCAADSGRRKKQIRVLLADDHRIVRQGFAALMRADEEIDVVGEAADGVEALELARLLHPDVVVMDVSMPKMNGVDATRWLTANLPRVRVIGLSMHEDEPVALAMREAGAVAFVTKDGPSAALMTAIHAARPGRQWTTERS